VAHNIARFVLSFAMSNTTESPRMSAAERRASGALASLFALRMLGLFLVLPVFALEAAHYPGGDNAAQVGLALGAYGLMQALLQIPMGAASDRFGRKRVIALGLLVFALGSAIAAAATTLDGLLLGRAIQGAGAVSAAISALVADLTRPAVRTKAMALVGISIAASFALSLLLAPSLAHAAGLSGIFSIITVLALLGVATLIWVVPPEPPRQAGPATMANLSVVLRSGALLRLDLGVFVLNAVQVAMWLGVPTLLEHAGLARAQHWQVYLPALVVSVLILGGVLFRLERKGHIKGVMLFSIALLLAVQPGLAWASQAQAGVWALGVLLFVFFLGFNALEASLPSLASKMASATQRGAALGVFNTAQALGIFTGGALGGVLLQHGGTAWLYGACAVALLAWAAAARGLDVQQAQH
jgi:predicted MFS family arabinose efflux permease